jgi:hypothetical protein
VNKISRLNITKKETIQIMLNAIVEEAERQNVNLSELDFDKENYQIVDALDDLFGDGGEARCEHFCDLAWKYALQFGEFADDKFEEKIWECIESAIDILKKKFV